MEKTDSEGNDQSIFKYRALPFRLLLMHAEPSTLDITYVRLLVAIINPLVLTDISCIILTLNFLPFR